jgi:predicted transcriptional regulator
VARSTSCAPTSGWEADDTVRVWLRPLRETGQVKPVRGATRAYDIRYVLGGEEPPPHLENDPAAIRAATTPLCRQIYAVLVELGSAESQEIAARIGKSRTVVSRLLVQMVNTGFVTMDVKRVPGRSGRTFTYTPSGKPLPPESDGPRWSAARRRVHDAVVELGEAQPHEIAARAAMHAGTIKAHLTVLVRDGYLERERRSRPKGSGVVMLYRPTEKPAPNRS